MVVPEPTLRKDPVWWRGFAAGSAQPDTSLQWSDVRQEGHESYARTASHNTQTHRGSGLATIAHLITAPGAALAHAISIPNAAHHGNSFEPFPLLR
jgi:hypothetical protein